MSSSQEHSDALNAFSRTVAAGLLMLAFVAGGYYLDKYLNTGFFVIIGFAVGMTASIAVMLIQAKLSEAENSVKHVKPLPQEDEDSQEENADR